MMAGKQEALARIQKRGYEVEIISLEVLLRILEC